ncbi:PREDICTED: eukaryotic translation initiation factor 3 subunit M-like [Priapulus caudatus]|uniref:Eukaryotic translation initiation factor 3 subunit M n=1 Tax=Priapulus caudatus TaxID=37621 RepID=A0ABM1E755_PRICU|nr:PREDICTED: eukaryotic translation initiation factor 3 subunit M-like [Priapulus caudatus]
MTSPGVAGFIDLSEVEQALELRGYLKQIGAEISEENSELGFAHDLTKIVEASDVLWKQASEADAECALNSVISLVMIIPQDQLESIVLPFIEKVVKSEKYPNLQVKILSNLLHGLDERSTLRYNVYCALLTVAGARKNIGSIETNITKVKKWIAVWDVSTDKVQTLYRLLYEALLENKHSEEATRVMIEMLSTYTEDNASQARSEAHRCIVSCIADPNVLIMDNLLALKPVKFLEGELIHDLLTIFVSGKLPQYQSFYQQNTDFVNSLGLQNEDNLHKMRLLTFISMAENKKDIHFDTIQQEMKISSDEVESFIIDVVRTKKVLCKMDQLQRKVVISYCVQRTYSKHHWVQLKERLENWRGNITSSQDSLRSVITMATTMPAGPPRA